MGAEAAIVGAQEIQVGCRPIAGHRNLMRSGWIAAKNRDRGGLGPEAGRLEPDDHFGRIALYFARSHAFLPAALCTLKGVRSPA